MRLSTDLEFHSYFSRVLLSSNASPSQGDWHYTLTLNYVQSILLFPAYLK